MRVQELYSRFCRTLRDFGPACRGNVAVTFVVLCVPVIGGVGAAVDYSRVNSIRAALQGALDSTALTLAKEA
jgi:Flp pilus assembly protein TadG